MRAPHTTLASIARVAVLGLAAVAAAAALGCTSSGTSADYLVERGDPYRGGVLWDTWWKVPEVKEAIKPGATVTVGDQDVVSSLPGDNPLYATNPAGNTRSGADTWRCKECHGWDYKGADGAYASGSHRTGFPGVFATRSRSTDDLFSAVRDGAGIGAGHAFGLVLSDADVADLVTFIQEGLADAATLVGSDGLAIGDPEAGRPLFDDSCANCHGRDGKKLNFLAGEYATEFVFNLAHGNPQEFIHKVRFGQPDGAMPNGSVKAYYLADVGNILAYAQSLAPAGLEEASAARGGTMWDAWWEVVGVEAPAGTNPLYSDPAYNTLGGAKTGEDTWRCKECHGWDYKGADGAYAAGSHATGIRGVFGAAPLAPTALIAIIGDGTFPDGRVLEGHRFKGDGMLGGGDVADLALFIREGLVDDADYVSYASGRSLGNPVAGQARFDTNCATCHGPTGLRVNFAFDEGAFEAEYVAEVARDNPYELLHKIRFGQPGSDEAAEELEGEFDIVLGHMPNKLDAGYSEQDVADIVAWAAMLPGTVERGGLLWDKWWEAPHVKEAIKPGETVVLEDGTSQTSSLPPTSALYVTNPAGNPRTGADTWRCKECHGWDYKGTDGVYATGGHATGFPGVFASRDLPKEQLATAIGGGTFPDGRSDPNHAFANVLGEWAVTDFVNFIQATLEVGREIVFSSGADKGKVKEIYVPFDAISAPDGMKERTRDASVVLGQLKFQTSCARCHGPDGRAIDFDGAPDVEEFVGDIAKDNPWELAHKIKHGQPGSDPIMPNAAGAGYTVDDLADVILYAQELP